MAFKYRRPSQEKLDERASKSGGEFDSFVKNEFKMYKVKPGDNHIRILPPTFEDDNEYYGLDVYVHYGVGPDNATVICPFKTRKERCPLCDAKAKAERSGDEDGARELRSAQRVLVWLIDRKDEALGPLLWAMPWGLAQDIIKVSKDKASGEWYFIDHPDEGYDVYFDKEGEKIKTKYKGVSLARKSSSVEDDWLDFIQDNPLPSVLIYRDYDEINMLYTGGMSEDTGSRDTDRRGSRDSNEPEPRERRSLSRDREQPSEDTGSRGREEPSSRNRDDDGDGNRRSSRRGNDDLDDDIPFDRDSPRGRSGGSAQSDRESDRREEPDDRSSGRRGLSRSSSSDRAEREEPARGRDDQTSGKERAGSLRERFSKR